MDMDQIFLVMLGVVRIGLRVVMGSFFVFQGINGFFHFIPIPEPSPRLAHFLSVFSSVPGFMKAVKFGQVLLGLCLVINFATALALVLLGIQVFGIFQLQWFLNQNRKLAIRIGVMYLVTVFVHLSDIWRLI